MPRIFDNLQPETQLLAELNETLSLDGVERADFCVGYFNLRGWGSISHQIDRFEGEANKQCRVLIGMQQRPEEAFREAMESWGDESLIDNATANLLRKRLAEELREQLTIGIPNNADERGLRHLAAQLKARKLVVKLFLRHKLHAKLYLVYQDMQKVKTKTPIIGYLGSSNLTFAGLAQQGELNIDVLDNDAAQKLSKWFQDRWEDRWCIDISKELIEIIESSWARETLTSPYHVYVKMAYHLSQEARTGVSEFSIPKELDALLFDYQKAAVQVAAHHLNKRGGVLIGDVVGLGKTLMATALARIFENDLGIDTLIICPKNLERMWTEDYVHRYGLRARVLPITRVTNELPNLRRYRLVIIDESHNLRNREGQRYRAIFDYLSQNESMCILLSATPYNKNYRDLSNQLRLFVAEEQDLGIRPEQLIRELGETQFVRKHQAGIRTLAAFEKSDHADDWRELMRLYMIRRTRSFIKQNYAQLDPENNLPYLTYADGGRSYFPVRIPRTVRFDVAEAAPHDPYARLYAEPVVQVINDLELPRYGLGQYTVKNAEQLAKGDERDMIENLSRAGKRLMGFCRTNLFKRLESSGEVFLQSLERHILRNYVYLYAIENKLELPIGTQDVSILDTRTSDQDADTVTGTLDLFDEEDIITPESEVIVEAWSEAAFKQRAQEIYHLYKNQQKKRFKWLRTDLFQKRLATHLQQDARALLQVMRDCGQWDIATDEKLRHLVHLLTEVHPHEKVLIFTQFADTVRYLERALQAYGIQRVAGVTGDSSDPSNIVYRFSPLSNQRRDKVRPENELRIVIATDVLSEGQNLQDCAIVVNYDLPWAIIRLIQRAGRVDRIGQRAQRILCYTFLPADGVERIIRLRERVRQRLTENAEVVGTDEAFFEEDANTQTLLNLYHEQSTVLEDDDDEEIDLASYAYQIWRNAIRLDPSLERSIPQMSPVSYATRQHIANPAEPEGVLVYLRTGNGNDLLAWVNDAGEIVTESQYEILNAARCAPETPALPRAEYHHEAVRQGVLQVIANQRQSPTGGQLGRPNGARFQTYERLKAFVTAPTYKMFEADYESRGLSKAIEDIYRYPLRQTALDTLNRQIKSRIPDDELANLVINLRDEGRLSIITEYTENTLSPRIVCSLGLLNIEG